MANTAGLLEAGAAELLSARSGLKKRIPLEEALSGAGEYAGYDGYAGRCFTAGAIQALVDADTRSEKASGWHTHRFKKYISAFS